MCDEREPRMATVNKLVVMLREGDYCAVLGPPRQGKTRLLRMLHEHLHGERLAMPNRIPVSAFVDLQERTADSPWTLRELINEICGNAGASPPFPNPNDVVDKTKAEQTLRELAANTSPRLAILLSPIDVVGEDVIRDFLEALGTIYDAGPQARPGVAIGGSLDLVHLTHGETSSFNMARRLFLEPAVREESAEALAEMVRRADLPALDDDVRDAILDLTDGHWDLMRMLVERLQERELDPTLDHLDSITMELEWAFRTGPSPEGTATAPRWPLDVSQAFAPVQDALRSIEARPEWLALVARLCSGEDPAPFGGGRRDPRMCLALRQVDDGYTFSTRLFERVLKAHFTFLHIADRFVLQRRWIEAETYYEKAEATRPTGSFRSEEYTLSDLVYAAFETLSLEVEERLLLDQVSRIARYVFGLQYACISEGTREAPGTWHWEPLAGNCLDRCARACTFTRDSIQKWAEIALRRGGPARLAGGRIVIDTVRLSEEGRCLALCTARQFGPQSDKQVQATRMLLGLCANRVEARRRRALDQQEIDRKSQEIDRQSLHLALARRLAETSQSAGDLAGVVEDVLAAFAEFDFPHVMISLLDEQRNWVEAHGASGDMTPLIPLTKRSMKGPDVRDDDDILALVIKTGQGIDVPDCFDPQYRCDQFAMKAIDPPLRRQIVRPLKGRAGISWRSSNVFGTIQVGRVQELPLPPAQQSMLGDLVRWASVVLSDALLSEERRRLIGVRDRQIDMMTSASRAAAELQDVNATLTTMLDAVRKNLGTMAGSIRLFDPVFQSLVCRAASGLEKNAQYILRQYEPNETSTFGWIYVNKRSLRNDLVSQVGVPYLKVLAEVQSNCGVPIFVSGQVEGALVVDSDHVLAFTDEDVQLLEAFASLTAGLIEGGRAFDLVSAHSKVSRALSSGDAWETRLEQVAEIAQHAVGADDCAIFLRRDSADSQFVLAATTSAELRSRIGEAASLSGGGRTSWVAKHSRSLRTRPGLRPDDLKRVYGDAVPLQELVGVQPSNTNEFQSFLGVAFCLAGECWGVLRCTVLFRGEPGQVFSNDDQNVLELIARELGVAVERRQMEQTRENTLAAAAHQMEGPVNAAMAVIRDMEMPELTEEERAEYLRDAHGWLAESLKRLAMVRNWERIRRGTMHVEQAEFLLRPVVEQIAKQRRQSLLEENISLKIHCPAALTVSGDRRLVGEILENLIDNAFYFTRDRIVVDCYELLWGDTRIEVRDNGPGLTSDARRRCFEPQYTTRSHRRGTEGLGLGLPISREYARLQGGDLICSERSVDRKGRGSVFVLWLWED